MAQELKLHSPAGAEPMVYTWPLSSFGSGKVSEYRFIEINWSGN